MRIGSFIASLVVLGGIALAACTEYEDRICGGSDTTCQCYDGKTSEPQAACDRGGKADRLCCKKRTSSSSSCTCRDHFPARCSRSESGSSCSCLDSPPSAGEVEVSECLPTGGSVCCQSAKGSGHPYCSCNQQSCAPYEKQVARCTAGVEQYFECGRDDDPVEDCKNPVVTNATSSSSSGSDTPPAGECTNKGFCGPTTDGCECGLLCLHVSLGGYTCGTTCETDLDCTSATNPISKRPYQRCSPPTEVNGNFYQGLCID